ncbi:YceD family protein [Poseidonocella sedimentorum]|uniref:Uncharacterized ACR, COG1399 n=1 Tax=Poseidonocella sedimentorum TaxID=871652 RepID=A0A1I6DG66_9RHOB|nr:DUF177 domain-containing protein [Poseidonocella sedimentorum]SFR04368.1 Uncharacterized ACR, COG1399 [Poseidonocella sedimentorum]
MTRQTPYAHPFHVSSLNGKKPTRFALLPSAEAREALRADLDLLALRKLTFEGEIRAEGKRGWRLEGALGATAEQACVVTGAPVTTRIEERVLRRFSPDLEEPDAEEVEMPQDDTLEPLGAEIDPGLVMAEALAIALPDYPRAPGVSFEDARATPPGAEEIRDEDLKPFAGLKALRDRLDPDET